MEQQMKRIIAAVLLSLVAVTATAEPFSGAKTASLAGKGMTIGGTTVALPLFVIAAIVGFFAYNADVIEPTPAKLPE
jgi:hypothetical protein